MKPKSPNGSLVGQKHNGRSLRWSDVLAVALARSPKDPLSTSIPLALAELLALPSELRIDSHQTTTNLVANGCIVDQQAGTVDLVAILGADEVHLEERPRRRV